MTQADREMIEKHNEYVERNPSWQYKFIPHWSVFGPSASAGSGTEKVVRYSLLLAIISLFAIGLTTSNEPKPNPELLQSIWGWFALAFIAYVIWENARSAGEISRRRSVLARFRPSIFENPAFVLNKRSKTLADVIKQEQHYESSAHQLRADYLERIANSKSDIYKLEIIMESLSVVKSNNKSNFLFVAMIDGLIEQTIGHKSEIEALKAQESANYAAERSRRWQEARDREAAMLFNLKAFLKEPISAHLGTLKSEYRNGVKKNAFGKVLSDNSLNVTQEFLDSIDLPEDYYDVKTETNEFGWPSILERISEFVTETVDRLYVPLNENISQMSGLEFEAHVRDRLLGLGWEASTTKASGDQGIDVVAIKGGVRLGIQCKLYTRNVSNSAIQEAFAGKQHYELNKVAVVTNGTFTKSAQELAKSTGVALIAYSNLDQIERMLI